MQKSLIIACLLFIPFHLESQPDSLSKKNKIVLISGIGTLGYVGSMIGLSKTWYSQYERESFHFYNDNKDWLQVDKYGHVLTAYYISKVSSDGLRWAGVNRNKSAILGGGFGFLYQSTIELLDGFCSEWGASVGDIVANTTGSLLFIGQELLWKEQRVTLKWSYHNSQLVKYRPDQFGKSWHEWWLKDYNGQTYWLSINPASFLQSESSRVPTWLNISLGIGGYGMLGGETNPSEYNGLILPKMQRYRQYYFSLDVDLSKVKTRNRYLKMVLNSINFIKIPFPAIEINKVDGFKFHYFYF